MFSQRLVFPHSAVLVANSPGCLRVDGGGNMLSLCLEPASRLLDVNRLVTVPCDRCTQSRVPRAVREEKKQLRHLPGEWKLLLRRGCVSGPRGGAT